MDFFKLGHSRPFFLYFRLFITVQYKFLLMTDSNLGPLELEATALPTEQQPL